MADSKIILDVPAAYTIADVYKADGTTALPAPDGNVLIADTEIVLRPKPWRTD